MLLIVTKTGRTWAWVAKHPDNDRAIAVGFGYMDQATARVQGELFIEWSKED